MDRKTALKLAENETARARIMEKYGLYKMATAARLKAQMLRDEAEYVKHEEGESI